MPALADRSDSLSDYSFKEPISDTSDLSTEEEIFAMSLALAKHKGFSLFTIVKEDRVLPGLVRKESVNYNRKEKSLQQLSKRFLAAFQGKNSGNIQLDKITKELGVQRRRIYDVINILESLNLVSRLGKNCYSWNGLQTMSKTISEIELTGQQISNNFFLKAYGKKDKSLQVLSIGFLNIFINCQRVISLQAAARKLSPYQTDQHRVKTRIRRLYDIANVFKSLGLVKKSICDNKKPGFQWLGCRAETAGPVQKKIYLVCESQNSGKGESRTPPRRVCREQGVTQTTSSSFKRYVKIE